MKKEMAHYLLCALVEDVETFSVRLIHDHFFDSAVRYLNVGQAAEKLLDRLGKAKPTLSRPLADAVRKLFKSASAINSEEWFYDLFRAVEGGPAYIERDYYNGAKADFDRQYREEYKLEPPEIPTQLA